MAFNNFPYTNLNEINLDWVINKQKETAVLATKANKTAEDTKAYVEDYFENLDITQEVNDKMDEMYEAGDFDDIFQRYQKLTGDVILISASFGLDHPYSGSAEIIPFTTQCKARIESYNSARKCYTHSIGTKAWHNDGFLEVIQALENTVTEPNNVSVVMVAGGGNDVSIPPNTLPSRPEGVEITQAEIAEGMQHFVAYVHQHYPNAVIKFAWLTWLRTFQSWRPFTGVNTTIGWMKELCGRNGIEYCLNSEYAYHQYYSDWYLADNYHPSTLGSTHIADSIIDCIIDGCTSVYRKEVIDSGFIVSKEAYASNPVQNLSSVTITMLNDITTITFNTRPGLYTFKKEHAVGYYIQSEDYEVPAYHDVNSDLVKSYFPVSDVSKWPVNIMAVGVEDDTFTKRDMFNGSGFIRSGMLVLAATRTDLYSSAAGAYSEDWFYIPATIVIPTLYA